MSQQPDDTIQVALYPGGIQIQNQYAIEPGVCVLPIAEDPPTDPNELQDWSPVVVLRLHAPYRIRRVSYSTKKENNPPVIPSPEDTGKFVMIRGDISFTNGLNNTLRNFDWGVDTDYLMVEDCVSRPRDGFVLGTPPWKWISSDENATQYGVPSPSIGAIAAAGDDAKTGYAQGLAATTGQTLGDEVTLNDSWGYNTPSYFSGAFLNSDMING